MITSQLSIVAKDMYVEKRAIANRNNLTKIQSVKTKIVFTETKYSVKAEIALMRNDPFMNAHNRLICHHWR